MGRIQPISLWWPCVILVRGPNNWIQHCCVALRRSQSKRNLGTCWLKRLLANKVASVCTRSKGWRHVSWVYSERFFPLFSSPQNPTSPNSNSTRYQVEEEPLCGCATSKSLFIYLTFRGLAPSVVANLFCFQYSDTALYTQLLYLSRLFDFDHAVKNAKTGQYFE